MKRFTFFFVTLALLLTSPDLRAQGVQMEFDYGFAIRKSSSVDKLVETSTGPDSLNLSFFPLIADDDPLLVGLRLQFGMLGGVSFAAVPTLKMEFPVYGDLVYVAPVISAPFYLQPEVLIGLAGGLHTAFNFWDHGRAFVQTDLQAFLAGKGLPKDNLLFEYRFTLGLAKRFF